MSLPDIETQVCADIKARQAVGVAKYGVTVADNPLNLRQWLQHAYEECLDQAVYLRRAMAEMDKESPSANIASAVHDAGGWVLFDAKGNVVEDWPEGWQDKMCCDFLQSLNIPIEP